MPGPRTVSIAAERAATNANADNPIFLRGLTFDLNNPDDWHNIVLPRIAEYVFTIESTVDIIFAGNIFQSGALPDLYQNVTKISFPGFHWFSGIGSNRRTNPYFMVAANLPGLEDVTFSLHTASLTMSIFGERMQVGMERENVDKSKESKVAKLEDVVAYFALDDLLKCRSLKYVGIEYHESSMTLHHTKNDNPVYLLQDLQSQIVSGFHSPRHECLCADLEGLMGLQ